jgi:RNA polymerase sigma-70 factor (ECF subfamily)
LAAGIADGDPTPEEHTISRERSERVRAALKKLKPLERDVILLAYYESLTQSDIARLTGIPLGTVKARMSSALRHLREDPALCDI